MAGYYPREVTIGEANTAVGELVLHMQQYLQKSSGITVAEIVKAGSLGHGTAVPGHFDLDLVLYSRDVDKSIVRDTDYSKWLDVLKRFLDQTLGGKFQFELKNRYIIQFKYDGKIDVDLLVSPYWANPQDLYGFLRTVPNHERQKFSVNASKWQVQFFQQQPNQVKEFIRRAKAWRNKKWPKGSSGSGRPKSYLMSVLVLRAYEDASRSVGTGHTQTIARQTTLVLQQMVNNHHKLDVYWETYYKRRDYPDLLPSRPRIIDPANPSNNLYETGICSYRSNQRASDYEPGDGDWTVFKMNIGTLDLTKSVEEM